jgi:iron complex outermembrane receptor protein
MKKWILGCLMVFSTIYAFGQGTITGNISDELGVGLAGASVYLVEAKKLVISEELGTYRFEDVAPGTYTIRVTYIGYETIERRTTVVEGIERNLVHAQLTRRVVQIRPAVIYATRADQDAPFTFTDLNRDAILAENLGQDVPYLLQRTPSAVVTSDAGTGIGYTGIRIRGTDPTRINVTINGIPLNDAESQNVFWVDLPDFASSTEDIQIQRGVGTSTNGAGAFGATINLNTNVPESDPYLTLDASGGSFNTLRGSLRFGTGEINNGFSLDGRLSRTVSDGYVDRASANLSSWYLSGAWMGEKQWVRLNAFSGHERTYQAWYGIPRDFTEQKDNPELRKFNPAGTEKPGEPYEDQVDDYTQTHLQLLYGVTINRNLNASAALHYTKGAGYYEEYKAFQYPVDYGLEPTGIATDLVRRRWLDNDFYGGVFSLNYANNSNRYRATLGGGWNEYLGGHFGEIIWSTNLPTIEPGERYYENDAVKRDFNAYLKQVFTIGQSLQAYVDLQYRRVDYQFEGPDQNGIPTDQDVTHNFFNPKVGLSYSLESGGLLFASGALANREPNRDDYVDSSPGSRPAAESLYDFEIGYRQDWEKASLEIVGYYMYYQDQLVLTGQINDVGAYTRTNVPESFRRGVELVGAIRPVEWVQLGGNVTLSQNRILNFVEFLDAYDADFNWLEQVSIEHGDTDLAFSPGLISALDLTFFPLAGKDKDLQIGLLNKYVGDQFVDNSGSENSILEAYFVSDLRVSYAFQPRKGPQSMEFTLLVRNLWDTWYSSNGWSYRYDFTGNITQDRGYYPQALRNFMAGVRVHF